MAKATNLITGAASDLVTKDDVKVQIDEALTKRLVAFGRWAATGLLLVGLGWTFGTLWQMNEKIHTIIGQEMVRGEMESLLKARVAALEAENSALKSRIDAGGRTKGGR